MSIVALNHVRNVRAGGFAQAVLLYLADAHNAATGKCCPSREKIAEFFSSEDDPCTVKRVDRALAKLRNLGLIRSTREKAPNGVMNMYSFPGLKHSSTVGGSPHDGVDPTVGGSPHGVQGSDPRWGRGVAPTVGAGTGNKNRERTGKEIYGPIPASSSSSESPEKPKRKRRTVVAKPQELTDQTWQDWKAQRNAKHAPITETVIRKFRSEAEKAGISLEEAVQYSIFRGWQGFQADWYLKNLAKERSTSTNRPLQREDMVYTDDF